MFYMFDLLLSGDFGSEFEGLRGGNRMMSLVTLFGGLKNVFKASISVNNKFLIVHPPR